MQGLPDFTVGGALRQTVDTLKQQAGTLLCLGFALYAVPAALMGLLPRLGFVPGTGMLRAVAAADGPVAPLVAYGLASAVVVLCGSLLASAATVWASFRGLYGRPSSFGEAAGEAGRVLPANIAMVILMGLGVMLGSLLLVIPGVMLFLRWSVAVPALVVERAGILGSLGRSRDLTRGHRWAVLGFLLVTGLLNLVAFAVFGFGGGLLGRVLGGIAGQALAVVANAVANAAMSAIGGAATAALYFELRRAGEGVASAETVEAFT